MKKLINFFKPKYKVIEINNTNAYVLQKINFFGDKTFFDGVIRFVPPNKSFKFFYDYDEVKENYEFFSKYYEYNVIKKYDKYSVVYLVNQKKYGVLNNKNNNLIFKLNNHIMKFSTEKDALSYIEVINS